MSSQTLSLSGTSSELECNFSPPLEVGNTSEIGVLSLQSYNSISNVKLGCDTFGIIGDDGKTVLIQVPTGCYEIIALETKIKELVEHSIGFITLISDNSSLKCIFYCSNDINFDVENSIAPLLGFNKRILKADIKHVSDYVVKIMHVNCIKVNCNLVIGSFEDGKQSHTHDTRVLPNGSTRFQDSRIA